jgi:hypothetical protein
MRAKYVFAWWDLRWELLNPDVETVYLPHPTPADGVEVAFTKL